MVEVVAAGAILAAMVAVPRLKCAHKIKMQWYGLITEPGVTILNGSFNDNGTTLADGAGWFFGAGVSGTAINCASNGNMQGDESGGIFGRGALNPTAYGCHSTGNIVGIGAGGICGALTTAADISGCYSTGNMEHVDSGGIIGRHTGDANIRRCYSTGNQLLSNCGGIAGRFANNTIIAESYTLGAILNGGGGIVGPDAGGVGPVTITKCYSRGTMPNSQCGGIAGRNPDRIIIENCYVDGNISASSAGLFFAGIVPTVGTITNCYVSSDSIDSLGFPLVGPLDAEPTNNITITNTAVTTGWNDVSADMYLVGAPTDNPWNVWGRTFGDPINTPYGLIAFGGVSCFFTNAPVLTPGGYVPIGTLRAGDLVTTADGRAVAIAKVRVQKVQAHANTNPYIIPAAKFGATEELLISPNHAIMTADGPVIARLAGLKQKRMLGALTYYGLELPNHDTDNLVVAGVVVESTAPIKRIEITATEFNSLPIAVRNYLLPTRKLGSNIEVSLYKKHGYAAVLKK